MIQGTESLEKFFKRQNIYINKSIQIYSSRKKRRTVCSNTWKGYKSACFKSNLSSELIYKYNSWKLSVSTQSLPSLSWFCFSFKHHAAELFLLLSFSKSLQMLLSALGTWGTPAPSPGYPRLSPAAVSGCACHQHHSKQHRYIIQGCVPADATFQKIQQHCNERIIFKASNPGA